jgi:hypothetical protein
MTSQAMHDLIATATKALSNAGATGVIIIIDGATEPRTLLAEPQSRGEGSLAACETQTQPGSAQAVPLAARLQNVTAGVTAPLPLAEWAGVISARWIQTVSVRELDRAVAANALAVEPKGDGRDHRIRLASPEAVRRYLSLCYAVQQGDEPSPEWWHKVRKGQNGNIG